ncbi:hypothetical protein JYU34_011342 [Plutella xylostella]|uniref:GRIP domain-containing protein n=1 Tax=Plutella xylostella TaxID=51655 RepID=A0ABQ7QGR7_PLUXY|nr:hypothetical protein JYU34_011342 [Plutella xylostella]
MEGSAGNATPDDASKKSPFDDLDREELIKKCKGLLVIAQKAKQAKTELQSEVESYKLLLEKCETEKKTNQESVFTLQELVDSLTEQKLSYITQIDSAKNNIKVLNQRCELLENELSKCKQELSEKDLHINEVTTQLSTCDTEVTSLKRQNSRLEEENEQLLNQLSDLEARIEEFNQIGLQQREQLQMLEEKVNTGSNSNKNEETMMEFERMNEKIKQLESQLRASMSEHEESKLLNENKIKEITQQFESEKDKKEKANVKLRSYKDKILKCAACINQLKNSRFILTKTVKEYSESIPKWQNDIIKASKFLDTQINQLSNENNALKLKLHELEKQINDFTGPSAINNTEQLKSLQKQYDDLVINNNKVSSELSELKIKYDQQNNSEIPYLKDDNKLLKEQVNELTQRINQLLSSNSELHNLVKEVETKNKKLNESLQMIQDKVQSSDNSTVENLSFQIKALESEKAILFKEKLNVKESLSEFENQNKILNDQVNRLNTEMRNLENQISILTQEKEMLKNNIPKETQADINEIMCEKMALQERYELLLKEHETITDLNGMLKDEVETLKLSLEQPKDDNLSDLNVSLQTDIVKLETKLAAYKQENASLLAEVKESRAKAKEVQAIATDYEDVKSKLVSYKTENTELLSEMKEINQVLKERGEAISKLQKAIGEMERLVETLEKDRDDVKKENNDLHVKVQTLEQELLNAEQKTTKNSEVTELIITERENAKKILAEKDSMINTLKEEIEKVKHQQSHMELPNDDNMSTSTTSKLEEHSRMKDLDDSFEDKYSKLRIFALKLKKKLNETNIELQNAEQDKARLEKIIAEHNAAKSSVQDEVDGPRNKEETVISQTHVTELEGRVESLTKDLESSKNILGELEKVKGELAAKCQQMNAEVEAHKVTKDNLEKARRDVKKRSVLSLEMEDYERSMKELTTKMEDNKKKMIQMESTIDTQEGTITAMKTQIKLLEEQIKTEETQNRLIKEELQHALEEGKEKDNVVHIKNGIISKLEIDLEDEKRKGEEVNIEMTSVLGEKEKVIIALGEEKLELLNKLKRMEFRCAELEEKIRITNIELEDLKTDYTSYKVRAQAVLRQNQTVDHSQEERLKEEAAAVKTQLEAVTAKLNAAVEKCSELQSCVEAERRRAGDAAGSAARAAQRTARLQADLARLAAQLDAERSQHKLQVSTLTQCYKTQISDLETKLQKEAADFKMQIAGLQEKMKASPQDKENRNVAPYMVPVIPKEDGSDTEMDINVSMLPREEGEGSESAPSPPLSKSFLTGGGGRSPVPLDRLLEDGVPEDEALDSTLALAPEQEVAELRRKLQAQQQRVKHITLLLSESERECARYAQMSSLLKAEVRRARGSLERTEHAHNAEYMKNVTLKFLTLAPGDERSRLVPVLQKILTLTTDETQKLNAVARGMDPNPGKGWGSYLPWPGGK